MKTSTYLTIGVVYSRKELPGLFSLIDATIRIGVFKPADLDSIWLNVTEEKPPDRTQYKDKLLGNILEKDG